MIIVTVEHWRDIATQVVYRSETFEDGSVSNPRPTSGTADATEQDYYVGRGDGEDATAAWVQAGIEAST